METSNRWFGLIVAYLVPGFIGLAGVSPFLPVVGEWLQPVSWGDWGIGPTIYALLAATGVGMMVSCFRWFIIDHVMEWTGVKPVVWDFSQMEKRLTALNYLVDGHYRYYQFYANTLVVGIWVYVINRLLYASPFLGFGTDLGAFLICVVLFAGSRDALTKYHQRVGQLLGNSRRKE